MLTARLRGNPEQRHFVPAGRIDDTECRILEDHVEPNQALFSGISRGLRASSGRSMRILIAIGVLRKREAGAAGVVFHHAEELQKLGHRVECWFFDDLLPMPRWPSRFKDLEFAFAVSSRIRREPGKYDVVNLHCPWGCVYGIARGRASDSRLPPYVFTMQGSEDRFAHAMRLEHEKGRARNFSWKNRVWHAVYHQNMYRYSIASADYGAVANREGWLLSELKYGQPPGRIWYVPNGVGEEFFQPREFGGDVANRLLYVGTWLDRKGVRYLVDAFTELTSKTEGMRLTIAGCLISEQAVKANFPEQIRGAITVIPFLARDAMPNLYASHGVFVFPSLVEGMPLTLLEAMAGAMPVVTTNCCGMSDIVEDARNGLLVPAADSAAICAAIQRLRTAPELRQNLGLCAQKTAKRYTWKNVVGELERVLKLALPSEQYGQASTRNEG